MTTPSWEVADISHDDAGGVSTVELRESGSGNSLKFCCGIANGAELESQLREVPIVPRLANIMVKLIGELGGHLECVQISDLVDQTYVSEAVVAFHDKKIQVTGRLTDLLTIAVAAKAPVMVADKVVAQL